MLSTTTSTQGHIKMALIIDIFNKRRSPQNDMLESEPLYEPVRCTWYVALRSICLDGMHLFRPSLELQFGYTGLLLSVLLYERSKL